MNELTRKDLLSLVSLIRATRDMLAEYLDEPEEEEQCLNCMARIVLRHLGADQIDWSKLEVIEAKALYQIVKDESVCPDIPAFLLNSFSARLKEVQANVINEGKEVDENLNVHNEVDENLNVHNDVDENLNDKVDQVSEKLGDNKGICRLF